MQAGTTAVGYLARFYAADGGDSNHHAGTRGAGLATHEVHVVALAAEAHAGIEFVESLDGVAVADGHAHQHLMRRAVHGRYVAQRHGHGLVAEVLQRRVHHVEIDALHEGLGIDKSQWAALYHGAVVAHTHDGRGVALLHVGGEALNQRHLAHVAYLCSSFLVLQLFLHNYPINLSINIAAATEALRLSAVPPMLGMSTGCVT